LRSSCCQDLKPSRPALFHIEVLGVSAPKTTSRACCRLSVVGQTMRWWHTSRKGARPVPSHLLYLNAAQHALGACFCFQVTQGLEKGGATQFGVARSASASGKPTRRPDRRTLCLLHDLTRRNLLETTEGRSRPCDLRPHIALTFRSLPSYASNSGSERDPAPCLNRWLLHKILIPRTSPSS